MDALADAVAVCNVFHAPHCAIDVWYQYPRDGGTRMPSRFPFDKLENVILTPHSSGLT